MRLQPLTNRTVLSASPISLQFLQHFTLVFTARSEAAVILDRPVQALSSLASVLRTLLPK